MTKKPSYNVTEFSDMYSSEQIHTRYKILRYVLQRANIDTCQNMI